MERIRNWAFQFGVEKMPTSQPDDESLQMVG
jgi:hypothetical protein